MNKWSMNYSSLEDAFGTPFGHRAPVTVTASAPSQPVDQPTQVQKSEQAIAKNKQLVESVAKSLPFDTNPVTENFRAPLPEAPLDPSIKLARSPPYFLGREKFTLSSSGGGDESKLDRILKLIEQNRTGYAPATTQDMLLYIVTGVFFLFTFDTFVMVGKSMRGR